VNSRLTSGASRSNTTSHFSTRPPASKLTSNISAADFKVNIVRVRGYRSRIQPSSECKGRGTESNSAYPGKQTRLDHYLRRCVCCRGRTASDFSTSGDRISARKVIAGVQTIQWLGQIFNNALRKLSQDGVGLSSYTSCTNSIQLGRQTDTRFEQQHGAGYKLT
jgi:hypothetical protein